MEQQKSGGAGANEQVEDENWNKNCSDVEA